MNDLLPGAGFEEWITVVETPRTGVKIPEVGVGFRRYR